MTKNNKNTNSNLSSFFAKMNEMKKLQPIPEKKEEEVILPDYNQYNQQSVDFWRGLALSQLHSLQVGEKAVLGVVKGNGSMTYPVTAEKIKCWLKPAQNRGEGIKVTFNVPGENPETFFPTEESKAGEYEHEGWRRSQNHN